MKILTNNRHEYIKELIRIQPEKIITFSTFVHIKLSHLPLKILMNTKAFEKQDFFPENWTFKTNNKIHAKLALGKDEAIIGSWNFSDYSTEAMHELSIVISKEENLDEFKKIEDYFEEIWTRSISRK